ncbi:MAG: acyltransferase [Psychrobium sp.]
MWKLISFSLYKWQFARFGNNTFISNPLAIYGSESISIGHNVFIRDGIRLEAINNDNSELTISIGNNVNIEQNVHIAAHHFIQIEDNVSIAGHCSIVDIIHPYDDLCERGRIGDRISPKYTPVKIGKGTMLGFGVHINPGVTIGKNCVVGAHAVVVNDIPDFSIAAGVPAIVIKRRMQKLTSG